MHTAHAKYLKSHLVHSLAVMIAAAASIGAAQAQTQTIATPPNVDAINLISPFSTLLGTTTINQNFTNAISINNNSTAAQRGQAIIDNTRTPDNGVVLSDALGSKMSAIWNRVNSQAANGTTVTFSNNLLQLFRQINAVSEDNAGKAKNFLADGSANGSVFVNNNNLALGKTATSNTPITNVSLPVGGTFNVYDKAYNPPAATRNLTGNSRPIQVSPGSIARFSAPNYFGVVESNTNIAGGVNGNVGTGLFADAADPSGHATFGHTTSLLFAMLVPERYSQFMARASEFGNSRVVLGVHYPLDVILGRVIGTYDVVQMLNNNPKYTNFTVNGDVTTTNNFQTVFTAAQTDVRNLLQTGCGSDLATCSATSTPDRFSNAAQNQADYIARLTYGLPTLSFAQAPREQAPAGGPDASILLATLYGGSTAAAKTIAPNGGILGSLQTSTINQIIVNTETNALAAFYGTPLSYWSRIDLFSAAVYFQNVSGVLTLASTDRLTTNVTIGSDGTFGGTGTVVGNTIVNGGGTLAPGVPNAPGLVSTPGTLTIQGSLAFQSGALYLVQVNSGTASSANVTAGATLAGTVQAAFASGSSVARNYTILSAAGGLNGTTFNTLTTSNLPAGFTASLSYTATDAILNLTATLGQPSGPGALACAFSINQCNVANALNAFFNNGGTLPPPFVSIFGLTGGNLANALSQLSGEAATGAQKVGFQLTDQFLNLMLDPFVDGRSGVGGADHPALGFAPNRETLPDDIALAYSKVLKAPPKAVPVYEPRWTVWGGAYGGSNRTTGDLAVVGSHDLSARTVGFAGGFDYRLTPETVVGLAFAGGGTDWSLSQGLGGGKSDAFQAGIYGATKSGPAYLAAAFAFTNHWMSTDRLAFGDHLTADFNAQSYGGRLEGGYRFGTPYGGITPYAAIQAQNFHTPGYTETGLVPNGFALSFNGRDATDTRSELGARFDRVLAVYSSAVLALRGRVAWAHDWVSDPTLTPLFQALPGASFIVNGAFLPQNSALVSAGGELRLANGVTLLAKFDGDFASHSTTYAGTGTIRYRW